MTIQEIKSIDFISYLNKSGITPKRNNGKYAFFLSPFGDESVASFCVNKSKNTFKCYHSQNSGSIIDFIMAKENLDFKEACNFLSNDGISDIKPYEPIKQKSGVIVHSVNNITSKALLDYFCGVRMIEEGVLIKYAKQLSISFPYGKNPNTTYDVAGMKNGLGGWDFRNNFMKMASAPKSFTKIKGLRNDRCILLEGFVDFLSYVTIYGRVEYDTYILNGLGQVNVLKPFLDGKDILFMLDNDKPADAVLKDMSDLNVTDMRHLYSFYNDFNDYLVDL